MRTIKVETLTKDAFAPFGVYNDMINPLGYALTGELHSFYPDRITESATTRFGFSTLTVKKPEKMIVTQVEYHNTTPEIILPLNDDMIVHVAPASAGVPLPEETKAFLIPKGTMVKLNTAIWHLAPLPVNEELLNVMIVLPECTYVNDCMVVDLEEQEYFEIIM